MYLVWMECQTAGCSNSLSQESLVVLDGTQVVPRRVVYTDKLVRGTTVTRQHACEELHKKYCTCISSDKISFDLLYILSMNMGIFTMITLRFMRPRIWTGICCGFKDHTIVCKLISIFTMMFVSLEDITQECIVSEFILTLTKLTHQRVCESLVLWFPG